MLIKRYFTPVLRYWWLLIIVTVVAGASAFIFSRNLPAVYESSATILIGKVLSSPNPSTYELGLSRQLAGLYAELARRSSVQEATRDALNLTELPKYEVRPLAGEFLIEIIVTDTIPERAMLVANELASQLIALTPTSEESLDQERQDFISQQLLYLEVKILETEDEIAETQLRLAGLTSAYELSEAEARIQALQEKLVTMQANYAALAASTQQDAVNVLSVIEPARIPVRPVGPKKGLIMAAAALIGMILSVAGAYLMDFFDDTIYSPDQADQLFEEVPILGYVAQSRDLGKANSGMAFVDQMPLSPEAESFRMLRASLEFANTRSGIFTLLVTSPSTMEGKSTLSLNIAASLVHDKKRVLLIDADVRKPSLHQRLGFDADLGLVDVLENELDLLETAYNYDGENFYVLSSGKSEKQLLEFHEVQKLIGLIHACGDRIDIVIIDAPPLMFSDSLIIASEVDGVLAVIRSGKTTQAAAHRMIKRLKSADAPLLGIVLNFVSARHLRSLDGYSYHYDYYNAGGKKKM